MKLNPEKANESLDIDKYWEQSFDYLSWTLKPPFPYVFYFGDPVCFLGGVNDFF